MPKSIKRGFNTNMHSMYIIITAYLKMVYMDNINNQKHDILQSVDVSSDITTKIRRKRSG
jgi:hypothetical protein